MGREVCRGVAIERVGLGLPYRELGWGRHREGWGRAAVERVGVGLPYRGFG